jgi:rhodanese-related sulfurtransferase
METGKRFIWNDFVVVGTILVITFMMFFRNQAQGSFDPNAFLSPEAVNTILENSMKGTPLDKTFQANSFSSTMKKDYYQVLDNLSQYSFVNSILRYINKNKGIFEDCSACSTDVSCEDSTQPVISYPIDLSIQSLHVKMDQYPKLIIIDVRNTQEYLASHIPSSANLPLDDLVDHIFTTDRWTEIVIVGSSYLQTKLAAETLLRLNFHRVHRLMAPVNKWDQELESYL